MKRALLLLLPAVLLVFLSIAGCNEETAPSVTRINVYPECGIAPLRVDCMAAASGGDESGDPTGGNNNLDFTWNFNDGTNGSETSISYHTFSEPGEYMVTVTAKDPDGKTASSSQLVRVMTDTLTIEAESNFPGGAVTTNDTVRFDVDAWACEIQRDIDDDYRNLTFKWGMDEFYEVIADGDTTLVEYEYTTRRPLFIFNEARPYAIEVAVTYPGLACTRKDTLHFDVVDP